ncbi:MAG: PQQ-binding-like beta-propeller repeat protein [Parcubacteria group bacterium]
MENNIWIKYKKQIQTTALIAVIILAGVFIFSQKNKISKIENESNKISSFPETPAKVPDFGPGFSILWITDFSGNRVLGFDPDGKVVWEQNMNSAPIPQTSWYFIGGIEYVTIATNGNLIASHGDGMMVQELDRQNHNLVWQYGTAGLQTYRGGVLDEPDKAFKFNDHEIVINDGNDRQVKVVDQKTNQVVWEYGEYHKMSSAPGFLKGNTSVRPLKGGQEFLITDTIEKKIMLVDRETKNIVWEYQKPDAEWLQNVFATDENTFVLEDRLKGEVFEVDRSGKILWLLNKLSDGKNLSGPTDTAKLSNGHVLIAESGRHRIVEVVPETGKIVREYLVRSFVSSMAVDKKSLDQKTAYRPTSQAVPEAEKIKTIQVNDLNTKSSGSPVFAGGGQAISGKVTAVNASTSRAGAFSMVADGIAYGVQVYNYSRVTTASGATLNLATLKKGDKVTVTGSIRGAYITATSVKRN